MSQPHGLNLGWLVKLLPIIKGILDLLAQLPRQQAADCGCGGSGAVTLSALNSMRADLISKQAQGVVPECLGKAVLAALTSIISALQAGDLMQFVKDAPAILADFFKCQYGMPQAEAQAKASECVVSLVGCYIQTRDPWACGLSFVQCLLSGMVTPADPVDPGTPPPTQGGYHGPVTRRC